MSTSRLAVSVLGLEGFAPEMFDTTNLALERALDLCEAYPNHTVAIDPA